MNKYMINKINMYQQNKSPYSMKKCRFLPTCSEYAKICYERFNFFKASYLTLKRLAKCNPFHKMTVDFPPEEKKYRHKYDTLEETLNKMYFESLLK